MAAFYMRSFDLERVYHPATLGTVANGFRHAATFQVSLEGEAFTIILVNVLWNEDKKLIKGSYHTETTVTDAGLSISPSGIGWAEVNDIPGEDAWVAVSKRVIRFSKRVTLKLPASPALSGIPVVGGIVDKLSPTNNWRAEFEGYLDVVSFVCKIKVTVY